MSNPKPSGQPCLIEIDPSKLSPSQQLALLTLRRRDKLAMAVSTRLKRSTVRAGMADYLALAEKGLAVRGADGWHILTGVGMIMAGVLTRTLAQEFGVVLDAPPRRAHGYQRQVYSQSGHW